MDADEQEWTVEGFIAEVDAICTNPPAAPSGFELVDCDAPDRHWPVYAAHVDGMYPMPCYQCISEADSRRVREYDCERTHRRWKSWRVWCWLSSKTYVLGITATGGGTSFGRCEFCGVTVQHHAPRWRGKRSYILGTHRESWACLRRGHRRADTGYGMCSICCPCPSCGSTDPAHVGDCGGQP